MVQDFTDTLVVLVSVKSCGKLSIRVEHYFAGRTITLCIFVVLKSGDCVPNTFMSPTLISSIETSWALRLRLRHIYLYRIAEKIGDYLSKLRSCE